MTERLSAADAAFLYSETGQAPAHTGGVVILDPVAGHPFDYQEIGELIETRLPLLPRYRQRVRFVPGRLARPVWVDDAGFDLDYHVRRSALPSPGTPAQLDDLVGRLISRPLDRTRPLWEIYLIEGLVGDRVAVVNKTHPALVDRLGAVDVAASILDTSRQDRQVLATPWIPAPPPSDLDLVVDAVGDLISRPSEAISAARLAVLDVRSAVGKATEVLSESAGLLRRAVTPAPPSLRGPGVGSARRFVSSALPLDAVKRIRRNHGGSVNDVVLALLTSALRSWMLAHGDAVTTSTRLRALVPMSVRTVDDGPSVVSFVVDLPVAETNPGVRLHQLSHATAAHSESGRQVGAEALLELGRLAPPTLHALGARVAGQLSGRGYDVLITNVPGPREVLFAAGYPVVAMYPVAPLARGHALSVAATSYHGAVYFGITADRGMVGDLSGFAEHIAEAVAELEPA